LFLFSFLTAVEVQQNNCFILQVVWVGLASPWVGAAAGGQGWQGHV